MLLDENGIVIIDYGDAFGGAGVQYNPQSIGYVAQILFATFSEGYGEYFKDDFLPRPIGWSIMPRSGTAS